MQYSIDTPTDPRGPYRLRDEATGASASVLPASGFNLYDLRLPLLGEVRPIIASAPGWAAAPIEPTRNGIPVLFPFPNRIRDAAYNFEGRSYTLAPNKPPHAIHGFAFDAPWDVIDAGVDATGAYLIGRFQIGRQAPEALASWPGDAILTLRYNLSHGRLSATASIENPGSSTLPWGLGFHAYFHLPIASGDDPADVRLQVPADEYWKLEQALPTGVRCPVDARLDFRQGQSVAGIVLDDVLTRLRADPDGWTTCRLIDDHSGAEIRLRTDPGFREIVAFTPSDDTAVIAIEPYTQTTDAIHLDALGVDAGLKRLAPGAKETVRLTIEASG